MSPLTLEKNLRALQLLYPQTKGAPPQLKAARIEGVPVWIKGAADVYKLPLPDVTIFLMFPKSEMTFDQLTSVYQQLARKLGAHLLVVADPLPAKHRPLLVKFRIPFIYKDESVFAPDLGVKFSNLKSINAEPRIEQDKADGLSPFAVKLVAGFLTNQLPAKTSLKRLKEVLHKKDFKLSAGKLSTALSDLAKNELLMAHGSGPTRTYVMENGQKLMSALLRAKVAPFFRELRVNYIPKERDAYTLAGERALAQFTNLAEPKEMTIAMPASRYREIFQQKKALISNGDLGDQATVQIWKEDPRLFSVKGALNPVELFLSMRAHPDERVQIELDELLGSYGLSRK